MTRRADMQPDWPKPRASTTAALDHRRLAAAIEAPHRSGSRSRARMHSWRVATRRPFRRCRRRAQRQTVHRPRVRVRDETNQRLCRCHSSALRLCCCSCEACAATRGGDPRTSPRAQNTVVHAPSSPARQSRRRSAGENQPGRGFAAEWRASGAVRRRRWRCALPRASRRHS